MQTSDVFTYVEDKQIDLTGKGNDGGVDIHREVEGKLYVSLQAKASFISDLVTNKLGYIGLETFEYTTLKKFDSPFRVYDFAYVDQINLNFISKIFIIRPNQ